jgi:hypothetical protein
MAAHEVCLQILSGLKNGVAHVAGIQVIHQSAQKRPADPLGLLRGYLNIIIIGTGTVNQCCRSAIRGVVLSRIQPLGVSENVKVSFYCDRKNYGYYRKRATPID